MAISSGAYTVDRAHGTVPTIRLRLEHSRLDDARQLAQLRPVVPENRLGRLYHLVDAKQRVMQSQLVWALDALFLSRQCRVQRQPAIVLVAGDRRPRRAVRQSGRS
jgi:hypothetical protein